MNWVDWWDSHVSLCLSRHLPTFVVLLAETRGPVKVDSIPFHHCLPWFHSGLGEKASLLDMEAAQDCLVFSTQTLKRGIFLCTVHLPGPWWAYSGGQGMLSSPEGEVVGGMRSQPLVCSLCTYIISQGWVIFLRVCVLCPSIIGKSRPTLVFRCRQLLTLECSVSWVCDRQEWSFFFTESQFDATLRTLKFMWHFPWRLEKLFEGLEKNKNHHSLETSPVGAVVSWILFYNFLIFALKVP